MLYRPIYFTIFLCILLSPRKLIGKFQSKFYVSLLDL